MAGAANADAAAAATGAIKVTAVMRKMVEETRSLLSTVNEGDFQPWMLEYRQRILREFAPLVDAADAAAAAGSDNGTRVYVKYIIRLRPHTTRLRPHIIRLRERIYVYVNAFYVYVHVHTSMAGGANADAAAAATGATGRYVYVHPHIIRLRSQMHDRCCEC